MVKPRCVCVAMMSPGRAFPVPISAFQTRKYGSIDCDDPHASGIVRWGICVLLTLVLSVSRVTFTLQVSGATCFIRVAFVGIDASTTAYLTTR